MAGFRDALDESKARAGRAEPEKPRARSFAGCVETYEKL